MQTFDGFPPGKDRLIQLPASVFHRLLPLIDDIAEMQVTLFALFAIQHKEGKYKYLRRADFVSHEALMNALAQIAPDAAPENTLDEALARAIARCTLLPATITLANEAEILYFINSDDGREGQRLAAAGAVRFDHAANGVEIIDRPTIYRLYERAFGLTLTPMLADELRDAEKEFPYEWIAEALRIAVLEEKRSWRYVLAILERWRKEGKKDEKSTRFAASDGRDPANPYAAFIRSRPEHGSPYDDDGS